MTREPSQDQPSTSVATSDRSSISDGERCQCGRFLLPRWCGTYGVPGETHTRTVCGPDGAVELNPIRAQLLSHLHPHDITDVQAWAIMCALISAFDMGQAVNAARVDALRVAVEGFAERDCTYGDGCSTVESLRRHGRCVGCIAREALGELAVDEGDRGEKTVVEQEPAPERKLR